MIRIREAYEPCFFFLILESDIQLFRLFHRTSDIALTVEDQKRPLDIIYIFFRRMIAHGINITEFSIHLPVAEIVADVGDAAKTHPVAYAALGDRRFEAVRMADDPVGH